jgi:hypothetical protein
MSMSLLHKIVLGVEIYAIAATALVIVSLLFRLVHHILGTSNSRPMTPDTHGVRPS